MTTVKELLKKVNCPKCKNHDVTKMELYFVGEREEKEHPVIVTKYVSCLECDAVFKIDEKDHTKEFLLQPVIAVGG